MQKPALRFLPYLINSIWPMENCSGYNEILDNVDILRECNLNLPGEKTQARLKRLSYRAS